MSAQQSLVPDAVDREHYVAFAAPSPNENAEELEDRLRPCAEATWNPLTLEWEAP